MCSIFDRTSLARSRSDHGSLAWLTNFKNPEGQLARWLEKLQEYYFQIEHHGGKRHGNIDALSRPCEQCGRESHDYEQNLVAPIYFEGSTLQGYSCEELEQLQREDDDLGWLMKHWEEEKKQNLTRGQAKKPECTRSSGRTCPSCATKKLPAPKKRAPLNPVRVGYPMQMVAVDLMGPFPESENGNSYILVAVDYFTRWMEAYAVPNQEATTVARKLAEEFFFWFSPPEQLHSDQGNNSNPNWWQRYAEY